MRGAFGFSFQQQAIVGAAMLGLATPAFAQVRNFDVPAQPASLGIPEFAKQAGLQIIASGSAVRNRRTNAVQGPHSADEGLRLLLDGTGLVAKPAGQTGIITIGSAEGNASAADPAASFDHPTLEGNAPALAPGPRSDQAIVVTGTHIRGAGSGASPITQYRRADIEAGGFATTGDFINSLPQTLSSATPIESVGGTGLIGQPINEAAGSGIDLRGLGPSSTLVLLNGKRLVASPPGDFVDVSAIPITAIERVDVITDGASAIYGSDAVGGVVNFVLRRDFDGLEGRFYYGGASDGGDQLRASAALGHVWSSGHALLTYEHFNETNLLASDRPYSAMLPAPTDLIPAQSSDSFIFSGGQDIAPFLRGTLDLTYEHRDVVRFGESAQFRGSNYRSHAFNATGGLDADLFSDWKANFAFTYGENYAYSSLFTPDGSILYPQADRIRMYNFELNGNGTLFQAPGGSVRLALGAALRREHLTESYVFYDVTPRVIKSAYAELFIPVVSPQNSIPAVRELSIDAAVRHEHYSDFGNTTNPKVGLTWSPLNDVVFRSTYGTSFRAPLFSEESSSGLSPLLYPLPDNSSPTGTTLTILNQGSGVGLGPEKAKTWTVGFDTHPNFIQHVSLSGTYFNIDYRDRIAVPDSNPINVLNQRSIFSSIINDQPTLQEIDALLANPNFLDLYFQPYVPSDIKAIVNNQLSNLSTTHLSGIDFRADYLRKVPIGQIELGINGTYLIHDINVIVPNSPPQENLNTPLNPVRLKFRGDATWSTDRWTVAAFVNYTAPYTNTLTNPPQAISAWTTVDLTGIYRVPADAPEAFRNSTVTLSVKNLFDANPPYVNFLISNFNAGFDTANANPIGRFISVELSKKW